MFKITGMPSWNLNADDFDAMVGFYRDKLHIDEGARQTIGGASVVRFRAGEQGVGLFDSSEGPRPGLPHHTFSCEGPSDPEELKQELELDGVSVESIRMERDGKGYSIYVLDPSQNRLELSVRAG